MGIPESTKSQRPTQMSYRSEIQQKVGPKRYWKEHRQNHRGERLHPKHLWAAAYARDAADSGCCSFGKELWRL